MISSERFLAILEERDLLPGNLLEGLREQIAQSKRPVPATAVAKRLIETGHLTPAQAERLLSTGSDEASAPTSGPAEPQPTEPKDSGLTPQQAADDELELAPLDDEPIPRPRPVTPRAPSRASAKGPTQDAGKKEPEEPAPPADRGSLLDEELPSVQAGRQGGPGMGPLDGLMADSHLDTAAGGGPLAPSAPRRKGLRRLFSTRKKVGEKTTVWDSPLLLIGGGALFTLVILFFVLRVAVTRQTGDEAVRQANQDYRAGSYNQAIHKYTEYINKFPDHPSVSLARVRRGLAQLRQVTPKGTSDWPTALQVARDVLAEIAPEREFKEAHGELSGMLLAIAEGLAAQARENPDPALVGQARETLALMKKYVPKSLPRGGEIAEIEASLALTVRVIARDEELEKAVAAMREAVARGNTPQAYNIRKALLKQYTELANDGQLKQVLMEVSRAQQDATEWVAKLQPAEVAEPATPVLATMALARRTTTTRVPGVDGRVVFALAGGAAYGLDAATGKVLWRRFVGFDANGRRPPFPPTPLGQEPGSDALLVDPLRNEVLRVEATTGRLCWRHAIGERFDAHPVIAGGQILVATRSGRLIRIDAANGSSPGYVQVPQPLLVAPAVDPRRRLVFQVADHSNLFVLRLADGRCTQVVHLGHDPGSVTAPPAVVSRFLFVAVNDRARDSVLRVLSIEEGEKGPSLRPVQQLRLQGHVDTTPLVDGRRVLVATDLGAVSLFEISGTDAKTPLGKAAEPTPPSEQRLTRFPLIKEGYFWIAGTQLTRYYIEAARGRLVPKWSRDEASAFQQPLVMIGGTIFHVRRKLGMPGVLVSAVEMDGGRRLWETHLAAPLPTEPMTDASESKITAVTSVGGLYQVDASDLEGQTVLDQPDIALESAQLRQPVSDVIRLGGGLLAVTTGEGSRQIAVFDLRQQQKQPRWLRLPDALACPPIAFAGGLLVPGKVGQVFLIDPQTGDKQTEPFQPRLESGVGLAWRLPAPVGENEVLLADGRTGLYRVGIKGQPKPHLAALDQRELFEPIVSPVAVVGSVAYAVDAAGVLAAYQLPKLTRTQDENRPLSGRPVWGPQRVGEHVMLATDDQQLFCLDGSGKLAWQAGLPYGSLAGTPLEANNSYILAATGGVVWRVEAATGRPLGKIETGRPLGTGPVLLGEQLLVGGHDGSLYLIEQP